MDRENQQHQSNDGSDQLSHARDNLFTDITNRTSSPNDDLRLEVKRRKKYVKLVVLQNSLHTKIICILLQKKTTQAFHHLIFYKLDAVSNENQEQKLMQNFKVTISTISFMQACHSTTKLCRHALLCMYIPLHILAYTSNAVNKSRSNRKTTKDQ